MTRESEWYRTVAGLALFAAGTVTVLGFVTAEVLFPGYSAADQTISRLGATGDPYDVVRPAATVFNGTMLVTGALVVVAAACLHRSYERRVLTGCVALAGVGVLGVGLFPIQTGVWHAIPALLAFGFGGLSAIVAATVVGPPLRYVSVALGVVSLVALVGFVGLGDAAPLGVGGIERWVAYPILLWETGFGGYLLGLASPDPDER